LRNLNNSNFNPLPTDIFKEDKYNNKVYKLFPWSKGIIINNLDIQNKLLSIESYKSFIISYKPPIIIPIIIFSFLIGIILHFTKTIDIDISQLIFNISIIFYLLICILYYLKIYFILRKNKKK